MAIAGNHCEGSSAWIVVNTHPHREQMAVDHLRRQDFEVYCPMLLKRRSHARRVSAVLRPLFPSYLFVGVDATLRRWRSVLSTYGVRSVARNGDELSFLDDAFIQNLKAREVNGAVVRPANPYRVGQKVCISSGPFDGIIATIIEMDERDRLVVLLNLMSRGIKVKVNSDCVAPA